MRKTYYYCEKYSRKIEQYLIDCGIRYQIVGDDKLVSKLISFVVYDDMSKDFYHLVHGKPIVANEFTKKELQLAEYLTIRPTKNIVDIINDREAFIFKCPKRSIFGLIKYEHKEQIRDLIVKPINTNGRTYFFSSSTGFSELFVKKDICEVIQKENIKGMILHPVNAEKNRINCDSGLLQAFSENVIKRETIYLSEKHKKIKCPVCGFQKIVCDPDYQLQLNESLENLTDDFYMTEAVFGEGISHPKFIVSHKFYSILLCNRMVSNVVFEPVIFMK